MYSTTIFSNVAAMFELCMPSGCVPLQASPAQCAAESELLPLRGFMHVYLQLGINFRTPLLRVPYPFSVYRRLLPVENPIHLRPSLFTS